MELTFATYTKRKVTIEAIKYINSQAMNDFIVEQTKDSKTPAQVRMEVCGCCDQYPEGFDRPVLYISTLEGAMEVRNGDYVVKGTNGEYYPCKPDPFHQVHSPTTDDWVWQQLTTDTLVDISDWIHGTDSSTFNSVAQGYLEGTYDAVGYLAVAQQNTSRVFQAKYGDYIARDSSGEFHVVTADVYRYMNR